MKADITKHYSVRSTRRHKKNNKRKSVKRSRLIRKACAKPTDAMIAKRRMDFISYNANLSVAQAFSAHAVNKIALVETTAVAMKQLKALWADEVALAMATK